jgi:hypothetical protein
MTWSLELIAGPRVGAHYILAEVPILIGRNPAVATLSFVEDTFLSGRHVTLHSRPTGVLVKDLGSTNGTFLNGQRIIEAEARAGDLITAGSLTLRVARQVAPDPLAAPAYPTALQPTYSDPALTMAMSLPSSTQVSQPAPASPQPIPQLVITQAPPPPAPPPPDPIGAALTYFASLATPLFCLVDAAVDPAIPALLNTAPERRQSLYDGQSASTLAQWAPYLIQLDPATPFTRALLTQGWGKGWASYLISTAPFEELRHHFRRFLMVQVENGEEVYFRFYDPRVMRDFLPAANPEEVTVFFGPIAGYLLEAEQPTMLLHLSRGATGLATAEVPLA